MNYIKRIAITLLAGIMVLALFTGCGKNGTKKMLEQAVLGAAAESAGKTYENDPELQKYALDYLQTCHKDGVLDDNLFAEWLDDLTNKYSGTSGLRLRVVAYETDEGQLIPVTEKKVAELKAYMSLWFQASSYQNESIGVVALENEDGSFYVACVGEFFYQGEQPSEQSAG